MGSEVRLQLVHRRQERPEAAPADAFQPRFAMQRRDELHKIEGHKDAEEAVDAPGSLLPGLGDRQSPLLHQLPELRRAIHALWKAQGVGEGAGAVPLLPDWNHVLAVGQAQGSAAEEGGGRGGGANCQVIPCSWSTDVGGRGL